jgi:hypothetical protein
MDHYKRTEDFPEDESLTGSEVPVNAFVTWNKLRYLNEVTVDTDEILGEDRGSFASIEINLPFDTLFSIFLVHGYNSVGELVLFQFVNRSMAETFAERELSDAVIWEIRDIHLEDMRAFKKTPITVDLC